MAQEFHVLRCFSCRIFQVQQVKKAKKWQCKVCGEKQSLIKEYGRGAAADCRRHVQKLNSLCAEMLEVNTETVLSQGEQDKDYQNERVCQDLNSSKSEQDVATVSCWNKYINQTTEGSKQEEEKEDANIYMEKHQIRSQGTRKRQLLSKLNVGGYCGNLEDESSTGSQSFKRKPNQTLQHYEKLSSLSNEEYTSKYSHHSGPDKVLCTSTCLPSSPQAVTSFHTASSSSYTMANCNKGLHNSSNNRKSVKESTFLLQPNNSPFESLSSQTFPGSKHENKASKWSKFLTVVPTQEEENVDEHLSTSPLIDHLMVSESTGGIMDVKSEEHSCPPIGKTDSYVPEKPKPVGEIYGNASSYYPTNRYLLTSEVTSTEKSLCKQPSLTNMLNQGLPLNPLFFTDNDFDDTF